MHFIENAQDDIKKVGNVLQLSFNDGQSHWTELLSFGFQRMQLIVKSAGLAACEGVLGTKRF